LVADRNNQSSAAEATAGCASITSPDEAKPLRLASSAPAPHRDRNCRRDKRPDCSTSGIELTSKTALRPWELVFIAIYSLFRRLPNAARFASLRAGAMADEPGDVFVAGTGYTSDERKWAADPRSGS